MKRILVFLGLVYCVLAFPQYEISPQDTAVCGGEKDTYTVTRYTWGLNFLCYDWHVEGGLFANGLTRYTTTDKYDNSVEVTWSNTPQSGDAYLRCEVELRTTEYVDELEPHIYAVSQPNQFGQVDGSGDIVVLTSSSSVNLTTGTSSGWWVDNYLWKFDPVVGTTDDYTTTTTSKSIPFDSFDEYGEVSVRTYNSYCSESSAARTAPIVRKLPTPTWNTTDEVMCNNTTSTFSINSVSNATSYLWVSTGGFTIWNGSSYVSSFTTANTSVTVKSRSTNGGGTINVTAKRTGTAVRDSEQLEKDLWSGVFYNTYVTGTAAVCHNSLYVYTAVPPVGNPSNYSYSWPTKPSGWYTYSTWSNNIQVQSPTLPENMTYGPIRAKIQNECGWNTEGGITLYPSYSCGGYYMAAPNPAGEYTEIDIASEDAKALEASYDSEIALTVVDKMGVTMMKEVVYDLPYQLSTSKLPKGEYVVQIISQAKDRETRVDALKIIVYH